MLPVHVVDGKSNSRRNTPFQIRNIGRTTSAPWLSRLIGKLPCNVSDQLVVCFRVLHMKSHCLKCQKGARYLLLFLEFYDLEEEGPHAAQGTVLKQAVE
jgi:hypothetical protein